MHDIYLYGMILATHSFLLRDAFPTLDQYGEIAKKYCLPGGETGTCATVLNSLGCKTILDGNHIGRNVEPVLKEFYQNTNVDLSYLTYDNAYDGLEDYVIIDQNTRTPFGMFQSFYSDTIKRWNSPNEQLIKDSLVVGLDPFFQEQAIEAAKLCVKYKRPYVTIDCPYDSYIHEHASINILSGEFFHYHYPEIRSSKSLYQKYLDHSKVDGLVIFTSGSKPLTYGRKSTGFKTFAPFKVETVSTLGAGDTFKAGCVYSLFHGLNDIDTIKFASACAAIACSRFPLPLNPPTLKEVTDLIHSK